MLVPGLDSPLVQFILERIGRCQRRGEHHGIHASCAMALGYRRSGCKPSSWPGSASRRWSIRRLAPLSGSMKPTSRIWQSSHRARSDTAFDAPPSPRVLEHRQHFIHERRSARHERLLRRRRTFPQDFGLPGLTADDDPREEVVGSSRVAQPVQVHVSFCVAGESHRPRMKRTGWEADLKAMRA